MSELSLKDRMHFGLMLPGPKWGLWHMRGKYWIGNEQVPNTYPDKELARLAATIATEMFGCHVVPRLLDADLVKTGDVTAKYTGLEALRRIEGFSDNS